MLDLIDPLFRWAALRCPSPHVGRLEIALAEFPPPRFARRGVTRLWPRRLAFRLAARLAIAAGLATDLAAGLAPGLVAGRGAT